MQEKLLESTGNYSSYSYSRNKFVKHRGLSSFHAPHEKVKFNLELEDGQVHQEDSFLLSWG